MGRSMIGELLYFFFLILLLLGDSLVKQHKVSV